MPSCAAPPALTAIDPALDRSAARIETGKPLDDRRGRLVLDPGSARAAPKLSYPSRLQAELRGAFPASTIRVINRGKGGEDAGEELARLDRDVVAEHPDLVIWQLGTNAVLRRDDLAADGELMRRGVELLKARRHRCRADGPAIRAARARPPGLRRRWSG